MGGNFMEADCVTPKEQSARNDNEVHCLVQDDCFQWRKAERCDQNWKPKLSAAQSNQAAERADENAADKAENAAIISPWDA